MEKANQVLVYALAIIIVLSFMILLGLLIFKGIPETNSELLYTMIGVFGTMTITVINYYFGSSAGSKQKTEMMNGKG